MRTWLALAAIVVGTCAGMVVGAVAYRDEWGAYVALRDGALRVLGRKQDEAGGTRFRLARHATQPAPSGDDLGNDMEIAEAQIQALEALGYAAGTREVTVDGGVQADSGDAVAKGHYLASDGHAPTAWLMDEQGEVLHTWTKSFDAAFPGHAVPPDTDGIGYFRRVALLPGGGLLAVYEGQGLIKLDAASNLVWAYQGLAHHDVEVQADGSIYTLTRKARIIPELDPTTPVLEDFVTRLSADGTVIDHLSLIEAVRDSPYRSLYMNSARVGDAFHTNSLEVLAEGIAYKHPAFKPGRILVSLLKAHAIVLVDPQHRQVVWALAGLTSKQHHPTMLPNGNLLVFDNFGDLGKSRVVEIDPSTSEVVWEYRGAQHDLFTACCGTTYMLPSGHVLITESENGRALIVDRQGASVWEYRTPHRAGDQNQFIATLFDVIKVPSDEDLTWLAQP